MRASVLEWARGTQILPVKWREKKIPPGPAKERE
jgi:hypothetical protein